MQYRKYGNTGLQLAALGFGAMRLPAEEERAVPLMERYLELGGNVIDTARAYGHSEEMVGKVLRGRREQVILSTKNHSLEMGRRHPQDWREYFEASLTTMDTDYLDLYHIHNIWFEGFEEVLYEPGGAWDQLMKAKDEGLVRHICFSCHDTPEAMMKFIDLGIFDGILLQYNLLDRLERFTGAHTGGTGNEQVISYAADKGLGVMVMGPMAGGRLMQGPAEQLRAILPEKTASIAELALRFVLANDHVTSALSGMNAMEQVEENCRVANQQGPLSEAERAAVLDAVAQMEKLAELYCTGCGYCLPCPQDIAIPALFSAMNYHRVWGLTDLAKGVYRRYGPNHPKGKQNASACTECGQCEERCPQNIPIIEQLKETHRALGE